jgi:hypothetical protein
MKTKISIRLFAIALIAMFTTVFVSPAMANDDKKAIPVELKFVGTMKEKPLFHLIFNGTEEKEYTITVRDVYGNVFYKETVKGTSFMKKFLINTDEFDETELKFEVSSKSYDKAVVFEVNNHSQYVENIVVNKVK